MMDALRPSIEEAFPIQSQVCRVAVCVCGIGRGWVDGSCGCVDSVGSGAVQQLWWGPPLIPCPLPSSCPLRALLMLLLPPPRTAPLCPPPPAQEVALDYIGKRGSTVGATRATRIQYARELLQKELLPHIGMEEFCETKKVSGVKCAMLCGQRGVGSTMGR